MGVEGATAVERFLERLLVPLAVLSGAAVLAGFFFPNAVGAVVSGGAWLAVALLFFGSVLGYLAVLPSADDDGDAALGAEYLLQIRRLSWRDALSGFVARQDAVTFGVPVIIFALYFGLQVAVPQATVGAVNTASDILLQDIGLVFLGAMFLAVVYCLFLLLGPWGEIRLGGPDAEPGYTYPTYFSLVFTAGIAAGIVFWGPAEALFHYQTPPPYFGAEAETGGAVLPALTYALFHWGISAWSAYTVIAVPIAYFVYQRGAPLRVSTILTPFLGVDGLESGWGKLVDTLAVFATIGGIATSVALVGEQFLTGINYQWGVTTGGLGPVVFVGGLTLIFILSATTGIHRGIRRIAGLNVVLFGLFALIIVGIGPLSFVLDRGTAAVGSYVVHFVPMSFFLGPDWVGDWTVYYWSWWFSWAPFAGLFLAALSRGRTVRTVVFTGVFATSAATVVWFLLLGGTSLQLQSTGAADILAAIGEHGVAVSGFPIFAALPLSDLLVFLFLGLIVMWITTSADTSTLVVAILASKRGLAPTSTSIAFWGVFQGAVAVAVLLLGGGGTLQALAVLTGGPFAVLSLVALGGLTLTFRRHEGGHTSLVRELGERLPAVGHHVDLEPPDEN
jgi:choline-glycine betaine transporter